MFCDPPGPFVIVILQQRRAIYPAARAMATVALWRSNSIHEPAIAIPPNVNGPPGHACVRKMTIPKLQITSTAMGPDERPARFATIPAAIAPTDKAIAPVTAKSDGPAPPITGCNQIASIAVRHASVAPEAWAAFARMPVP